MEVEGGVEQVEGRAVRRFQSTGEERTTKAQQILNDKIHKEKLEKKLAENPPVRKSTRLEKKVQSL